MQLSDSYRVQCVLLWAGAASPLLLVAAGAYFACCLLPAELRTCREAAACKAQCALQHESPAGPAPQYPRGPANPAAKLVPRRQPAQAAAAATGACSLEEAWAVLAALLWLAMRAPIFGTLALVFAYAVLLPVQLGCGDTGDDDAKGVAAAATPAAPAAHAAPETSAGGPTHAAAPGADLSADTPVQAGAEVQVVDARRAPTDSCDFWHATVGEDAPLPPVPAPLPQRQATGGTAPLVPPSAPRRPTPAPIEAAIQLALLNPDGHSFSSPASPKGSFQPGSGHSCQTAVCEGLDIAALATLNWQQQQQEPPLPSSLQRVCGADSAEACPVSPSPQQPQQQGGPPGAAPAAAGTPVRHPLPAAALHGTQLPPVTDGLQKCLSPELVSEGPLAAPSSRRRSPSAPSASARTLGGWDGRERPLATSPRGSAAWPPSPPSWGSPRPQAQLLVGAPPGGAVEVASLELSCGSASSGGASSGGSASCGGSGSASQAAWAGWFARRATADAPSRGVRRVLGDEDGAAGDVELWLQALRCQDYKADSAAFPNLRDAAPTAAPARALSAPPPLPLPRPALTVGCNAEAQAQTLARPRAALKGQASPGPEEGAGAKPSAVPITAPELRVSRATGAPAPASAASAPPTPSRASSPRASPSQRTPTASPHHEAVTGRASLPPPSAARPKPPLPASPPSSQDEERQAARAPAASPQGACERRCLPVELLSQRPEAPWHAFARAAQLPFPDAATTRCVGQTEHQRGGWRMRKCNSSAPCLA
jgi:hypothetical protein